MALYVVFALKCSWGKLHCLIIGNKRILSIWCVTNKYFRWELLKVNQQEVSFKAKGILIYLLKESLDILRLHLTSKYFQTFSILVHIYLPRKFLDDEVESVIGSVFFQKRKRNSWSLLIFFSCFDFEKKKE